jgi:hypothetical protein
MDLREISWVCICVCVCVLCGMDSPCSGQEPMVGSDVCGNEPLVSGTTELVS